MKTMKKGFTLIELLVVIAIIGILAATVLLGMRSARSKARDTSRKSNVRNIMNALNIIYDDASPNAYPTGGGTAAANLSAAFGGSLAGVNFASLKSDDRTAVYSGTAVTTAHLSTQTLTQVGANAQDCWVAQELEGNASNPVFVAESPR